MNSKVSNFPISRIHDLKSQKREFQTNFVLKYIHWPSLTLDIYEHKVLFHNVHNVKPIKAVFKSMKRNSFSGKSLGSSCHHKKDLRSFY